MDIIVIILPWLSMLIYHIWDEQYEHEHHHYHDHMIIVTTTIYELKASYSVVSGLSPAWNSYAAENESEHTESCSIVLQLQWCICINNKSLLK